MYDAGLSDIFRMWHKKLGYKLTVTRKNHQNVLFNGSPLMYRLKRRASSTTLMFLSGLKHLRFTPSFSPSN